MLTKLSKEFDSRRFFQIGLLRTWPFESTSTGEPCIKDLSIVNQDDFFRPLQGIVYIVSGHQYSDSLVNQHVYDFVDNDLCLGSVRKPARPR